MVAFDKQPAMQILLKEPFLLGFGWKPNRLVSRRDSLSPSIFCLFTVHSFVHNLTLFLKIPIRYRR